MKRRIACIVMIVVMLLLVGCDSTQFQSSFVYTFRQDQSEVVKIEICKYEEGFPLGIITPLVQLPETATKTFWADILDLECRETWKVDTPTGYGDLIFQITYKNGEREILGLQWIGFISPDNTNTETLQYFDPVELSKVFAKYEDPEVLSEVSEDFRHWYAQRQQ